LQRVRMYVKVCITRRTRSYTRGLIRAEVNMYTTSDWLTDWLIDFFSFFQSFTCPSPPPFSATARSLANVRQISYDVDIQVEFVIISWKRNRGSDLRGFRIMRIEMKISPLMEWEIASSDGTKTLSDNCRKSR